MLQDLTNAGYDPNAMIDPTTGKPYAYGTPGYEGGQLSYLMPQLDAANKEGANGRNTLFSGATGDQGLAARATLLAQLGNTTSQQQEAEKMALEQQAFQAQERSSQNQADATMTREKGLADAKAAAIGGGTNALGQFGGLYLMNKFPQLLGGKAAGAAGTSLADIGGGSEFVNGVDASGGVTTGRGLLGGGGASTSAVDVPWADGLSPGGTTGWGGVSKGGLTGSDIAGGLGTTLGAGLGAYGGYQLGGGGNSTVEKVGGGLGGLGGAELGFALGGPVGAALGGGLGAWGGKEITNGLGKLFHWL